MTRASYTRIAFVVGFSYQVVRRRCRHGVMMPWPQCFNEYRRGRLVCFIAGCSVKGVCLYDSCVSLPPPTTSRNLPPFVPCVRPSRSPRTAAHGARTYAFAAVWFLSSHRPTVREM